MLDYNNTLCCVVNFWVFGFKFALVTGIVQLHSSKVC